MYLVFAGAVALYVLAGEVINGSDPDFRGKGFVDIGAGIWFARGIFALFALQHLVVQRFLIKENRIVAKVMELEPKRADAALVRALISVELLRAAGVNAIGIYGLILFFLGGNQFDLLVPAGVALLLLLWLRPNRSHWERLFREAATAYPGVSSSPWASTAV